MKKILSIFVLMLCAGSLCAQLTQPQLTALYDSLLHPVLDDNAFSDVANVSIQRGGQTISLSSGTIRFFAPVRGRIFGAVFMGTGHYVVAPPTQVEKMEFERQTNNKLDSAGTYSYEFQRAVLWFADSINEELRPHCQFRSHGVQRPERDAVNRSLKFATDPSNQNSLYRILGEMMEDHPEPYLFGHFLLDRDGNDLFLECDERRFEEVVISQPTVGYSGGFNFWRNPLCSFHLTEEYRSMSEFDLSGEDKRRIDLDRTSVDLFLARDRNVQGKATISFSPISGRPASIELLLHPVFEVTSVADASGKPLSFVRGDKAWEVFVALPGGPADTAVTLSYKGDFIDLRNFGVDQNKLLSGRRENLIVADLKPPDYRPLSATAWYPTALSWDRNYFDVTYHIPRDMAIVSGGTKISDTTINDTRSVRYATKFPSVITSFSFGEYEEKDVRLFSDEAPVRVFEVKSGNPVRVGVDLANSMHFFNYMFGRIPYSEVKVTSSPGGNGQAFPEFIHLPWVEERIGEQEASISLDRAHEMSHAWWGHVVGWRSYHDQWLSEGFAHYSALLYVLYVLKQNNPFYGKLQEWKDGIVGARELAFYSGPKAGSIWLGYRSSSQKTPNDPTLLIYQKGAWVLHMLRMLMMDLQTSKEDAFKAMMRDYYSSFNGMDPGTTDFQHIVEKYLRMDMSWFFNEWVYRIEIPRYKVHHTFTKNGDGKWTVSISVKESGVPESFKMFVPIEIKLKGGNTALTRLLIDAPSKDFSYELDAEPEAVVFNKFESVLCTVEE